MMKIGTYNVPVSFNTDEFTDTPDYVAVSITPEILADMKTAVELMAENRFIHSVRIEFQAHDFINEDGSGNDFRPGVELLIIYPEGGVYYYAQNEGNIQIETAALNVHCK